MFSFPVPIHILLLEEIDDPATDDLGLESTSPSSTNASSNLHVRQPIEFEGLKPNLFGPAECDLLFLYTAFSIPQQAEPRFKASGSLSIVVNAPSFLFCV